MSGGGANRFLTKVLMTDMVSSTELAVELGDRGWRELVQLHNALVREALRRYDGREMDTAGDGFFAAITAARSEEHRGCQERYSSGRACGHGGSPAYSSTGTTWRLRQTLSPSAQF